MLDHLLGGKFLFTATGADKLISRSYDAQRELAELAQRWLLLNKADHAAVWRIVAPLGRMGAGQESGQGAAQRDPA
ncbi:MAG: hypothetical protein ACYC05_15085 [Sulfuricella sp.]